MLLCDPLCLINDTSLLLASSFFFDLDPIKCYREYRAIIGQHREAIARGSCFSLMILRHWSAAKHHKDFGEIMQNETHKKIKQKKNFIICDVMA